MEKTCGQCSQIITGIDSVACRGYCGCMFHLACSGVSRALLGYFTSHQKNLFWMCDECAKLFENSHLRSITKSADENSPLVSLTEAINGLQKEIKSLSKPTPSQLNLRWPSIEHRRPAKRPRGPDLDASECIAGSKRIVENVVSVPICEKPADKFWLYLSRIRPDVTNDEISAMVRANLELSQDPVVVKLVAKGSDISNMTFVSFKVGLDPALQSIALDPSTWPQGIYFRQFEEKSTQKFWKPLASPSVTPTPGISQH
ncbi:uncharacterized protein LOC131434281 [Malaya genurostris]|uniref:uncharacterized protein LOC131434281 n=1 Tax=Malaya genurostris TaxID=325434 RepID=UPI0026F3A0FB|nr:uncharacterized protein LOC131434281 [Malaya genurostris]